MYVLRTVAAYDLVKKWVKMLLTPPESRKEDDQSSDPSDLNRHLPYHAQLHNPEIFPELHNFDKYFILAPKSLNNNSLHMSMMFKNIFRSTGYSMKHNNVLYYRQQSTMHYIDYDNRNNGDMILQYLGFR